LLAEPLLQLAPVDELHVPDRCSARAARVRVLQPAAQGLEHVRPVVVESSSVVRCGASE